MCISVRSIETGDGMPPLTTCACNLSTFWPRYDAPGANPSAATSSCATSNFIIGVDIGTVAGSFPVQRWRYVEFL